MATLMAESGGNKGQFSTHVEAICLDFRRHEEEVEGSGYYFHNRSFPRRQIEVVVDVMGAP
jgi:hypothetical protein